MTGISRHFATVGQRQVHYRRAGTGPLVFLLNQSPNSSSEYIPLIQRLARAHTVIAPDTPGNGLSDPLPLAEPTMGDYADALVGLFDELAVERAPVYGFHTGGLCALEMARRHPDRVVETYTNGYVHMDEDVIQEILANYFAELHIDWTGSHLTWIWARMRNQYLFFPWYRTDAASRMSYDMPPPERIHQAVMEILRAGDNYRGPYRSAFTFSAAEAVQEAKAPAVVMTSKTDVLFPGMAKMPKPAPSVRTFEPDTHPESEDLLERLLSENPGPTGLPNKATRPMPGGLFSEFIPVDGGYLFCRRNVDADGRLVIFQHASAGSSHSHRRLMEEFIGRRPVLAVDLPGNGESEGLIASDEDCVERQAAYLAQAIKQLGYKEVDFFGDWGGGAVGIELSLQEPDLVRHLAIPNLMVLDGAARQDYLQRYTPEIVPDEYGTHLVKVWNMIRDQQLFAPWFKQKKENITRANDPDIDPLILHQRTMDLLKCGNRYREIYAAHFDYPVAEKLPEVRCPVLLGNPDSPSSRAAESWGVPDCQFRSLAAKDWPRLREQLITFFDA